MYKFTYKRPFENMPILLEHFNTEICISSLKIMTADFITYIQKDNNQRRFFKVTYDSLTLNWKL